MYLSACRRLCPNSFAIFSINKFSFLAFSVSVPGNNHAPTMRRFFSLLSLLELSLFLFYRHHQNAKQQINTSSIVRPAFNTLISHCVLIARLQSRDAGPRCLLSQCSFSDGWPRTDSADLETTEDRMKTPRTGDIPG